MSDLPKFLDQVLERFPMLVDLSMMRNPACPGLMDIQRPDMEACRMYRTYVVFRAPQLVTVDGVDVTEEVRVTCFAGNDVNSPATTHFGSRYHVQAFRGMWFEHHVRR